MAAMHDGRVLLVDLNNFARYPTIPIGYLAAILRSAGMQVEVFSPLSKGVAGVVREPRARPWGLVDQRLRYWSAVSRNRLVKRARRVLAARNRPRLAREADRVAGEFNAALTARRPDAVLVSTYLMYHGLCEQIGRQCAAQDVPMLIGGPYFAQPEVVREWIDLPGAAGIAGGEVELQAPAIVERMMARQPLDELAGIWTRGMAGELRGGAAPPLRDLDAIPFPDYRDFPWHRYPNRMVPIITGRGCAWGACLFCSDVTSTAGRSFRSRSPQNVLDEIQFQARRHDSRLVVFTDLKLNSDLGMWHALLEGMQAAAPGVEWVAAVHIGARQPNGLTREELEAARAAGMVRLTTGLESGSQRVLGAMCKGTDLAVTSRCLRDARAAGISVRVTLVLGYPGEEAADVRMTAAFLRQHRDCIERVSLNRFQIMTGTRFHRRLQAAPKAFAGVTRLTVNHRVAQLDHHYVPTESREYRRAASELIGEVHRINRGALLPQARAFEGVM